MPIGSTEKQGWWDVKLEDNVNVYMDASGSGYGVVAPGDWIAGTWKKNLDSTTDYHGHLRHTPDTDVPENINIQELYPVIESLLRWGPKWRNCRVVCFSDNTQAVACINTSRSDNVVAMSFLRRIFWLSVLYNCHVVACHILTN